MTFRSTSITASGEAYAMAGDLTIKGATHPVVLHTTCNGSALFPMDRSTHQGFSATATISRSAYGVSYSVPMVSDDVTLKLNVQFVSPAVDA